jgi:hypothetical protein
MYCSTLFVNHKLLTTNYKLIMLRFFSRVAFIFNIFFLLAVALQYKSFIKEESLVYNFIIVSFFPAVFLFSPIINISYFITILVKRKLFSLVPKWLVLTNFIMLIIQILYIIIFLNDPFYY